MQYQPELPPAPSAEAPAQKEADSRRVHPLLILGFAASLGAFALLALPDLLEQPAASHGAPQVHGSPCSASKAAQAPSAKAVAAPQQAATAQAPPAAVPPAGDVADDKADKRRKGARRKIAAE